LAKKIEEYQDYARRIHILGAELDRLTHINKGLEEDNKAMRLKYSTNINFEKREEEMALAKVIMAVEIENLRMRIE
jgi:cell shape-determining protein MreC